MVSILLRTESRRYATQPNISLTDAWTLVADGSSDGVAQVVGWPAIFAIGSAAPGAGTSNGHASSDQFVWSGLTTEKVYARAVSADRPTTLAVTRT